MFRIDLHTHSIVSQDGGISFERYKNLIANKSLDYIAITDHNDISGALKLQESIGQNIIVGEEILTTDGEIIGLYLNSRIESGLTAKETIQKIREQNGLVYIPHPFETMRKGLSKEVLTLVIEEVDIIETFNARGRFRNHSLETKQPPFSNLPFASSSDAHCRFGIGTAYSVVSEPPTRENLQALLLAGSREEKFAPMPSYLCPTINRFKKRFA